MKSLSIFIIEVACHLFCLKRWILLSFFYYYFFNNRLLNLPGVLLSVHFRVLYLSWSSLLPYSLDYIHYVSAIISISFLSCTWSFCSFSMIEVSIFYLLMWYSLMKNLDCGSRKSSAKTHTHTKKKLMQKVRKCECRRLEKSNAED